MLHDFLIFYAPILMVIASIAVGFWLAVRDAGVEE